MPAVTNNALGPIVAHDNRWLADQFGELMEAAGGQIQIGGDVDHVRDIEPLTCLDDSGKLFIKTSETLNVDIEDSGLGGLDTGVVAASTWYALWVLYNLRDNLVSAVFSESFTEPAAPAPYTFKRLWGVARTDASENLRNILQVEVSGRRRVYSYEADPTANLSEGRVTLPSPLPVAYTLIDMSEALPPVSDTLYLLTRNLVGTGVTSNEFRWRTVGDTDTTPSQRRIFNGFSGPSFLQYNWEVAELYCPGQQIEFEVSFAGGVIEDISSLWYPLRFAHIV